jgi:hypothetical protein
VFRVLLCVRVCVGVTPEYKYKGLYTLQRLYIIYNPPVFCTV